jgi:DNA-binding MarR family transcriptional regulator
MEEDIETIFKEITFLNFQKNYLRLKEIGLYPGQEIVIDYIINHEGVTQSELVAITKRKAATIAKTISRLVQSGYILRIEDKKDKRIHHLYATNLGRITYDKMVALKKKNYDDFNSLFNKDEKKIILNYLMRIRDNLKGEKKDEKNI